MLDWLRCTLAVTLLCGGCATAPGTVATVAPMVPEARNTGEPGASSGALLDVGIAVFANGETPVDSVDLSPHAEVRRAERNYLPYLLRNQLQATGEWGAVRVLSRPSDAVEVTVTGTITRSDGEVLAFRAQATDARGVQWFDNEYVAAVQPEAYRSDGRRDDPFASAYAALVADMATGVRALRERDLARIREVAALKFAQSLAPGAFARHVAPTPDGRLELRRLPAREDPLFERVDEVRRREHLLIDTVDHYYDEFGTSIQVPYEEWRRATFHGRTAQRELELEADAHMLLGSSRVIAGLSRMDRDTPGRLGLRWVAGGLRLIRDAERRTDAVQAQAQSLRELGVATEENLLPHTTSLENRTAGLHREVDDSYEALRRIFDALFEEEMGFSRATNAIPPNAPDTSTAREPAATPARSAGGHATTRSTEREVEPERLGNRPIGQPMNPADPQVQTGSAQEALDMLEEVLAEDTDTPAKHSAQTYTSLALRHLAKDDDAQAVAAFQEVVDAACTTVCSRGSRALASASTHLQPRYPATRPALSELVLRPAERMIENGDYDPAIAMLSNVVDGGDRAPSAGGLKWASQVRSARKFARYRLKAAELANAYRVLARAHLANNDYAAAIEAYERILEQGGKLPPWVIEASYEDLALIHFLRKDYAKSLECQRRWLGRAEWVASACPKVCPSG